MVERIFLLYFKERNKEEQEEKKNPSKEIWIKKFIANNVTVS